MRINSILKVINKDNVKILDVINGRYKHISYSLFYQKKRNNYEHKDIKNPRKETIRNFLEYTRK